MISDLKAIQPILKNYPVAYLMRHAHRFDIPKGSYGNNIGLTLQGEKETKKLAQIFKPYVIETYSSPVPRCISTAMYFQANSKTGNLIPHKYLGAPGAYIEDEHLAGPLFLQITSREIALNLIKGKNLPGFLKALPASENLLQALIAAMNNGVGLYPFISHDYIIAIFLNSFLPPKDCKIIWPQYLEGVFVWVDETSVNFRFRSDTYAVNLISGIIKG